MDIALVVATAILVGVTAYYAWQTHETVDELRKQREQAAAAEERRQRDEERRRREVVTSLREGVINELELINAIVIGAPFQGVQYARTEQARFPRDAWKAAFGNSDAFPPGETRNELHALYALIERVNGLTEVLLYLGVDVRSTGGDAERERTSGMRGLLASVPKAIDMIRSLPPPT